MLVLALPAKKTHKLDKILFWVLFTFFQFPRLKNILFASVTDKEVNALQKFEFVLFVVFLKQKTYFHCECSCFWGQIETGKISQSGRFYSSEEAVTNFETPERRCRCWYWSSMKWENEIIVEEMLQKKVWTA